MCALLGSFVPEAVSSTTFAAFTPYLWLIDLLSNPSYTPVQTLHQHPAPAIPSAFMSSTLRASDAILAVQSLYLPLSKTTSTASIDGELLTLYILGAGLSGHRGVAHGGLVATLLDQQMGSLVIADSEIINPRTMFCNVSFLDVVRVPGAVKVRTWKTKVEGRKVWVKAEILGKEGKLAEAEALFIGKRGKL